MSNGLKKLQVKDVTLAVIAHRHRADGTRETTCFQATAPKKGKHNKSDLLQFICQRYWGHNAPVGAIFDYLLQTKAYALTKDFGFFGYEMNFYEKGADKDKIDSYSCRQIMGIGHPESFMKRKDEVERAIRQDPNMSIRVHQ